MSAIFFNYRPDEIISNKIVGFDSCVFSHDEIHLYAFVEVTIVHPDAPNDATLTTIEKRLLKKFSAGDTAKAKSAAFLLAHAQSNMRNILEDLASLI